MPANKEKVTMKTIADEAGVTLTTVSRILNKKDGKYSESTKERIFAIAERLKYRPNALVQGMQTGRTGMAGVMVPAVGYYSEIVGGIHEVFLDHDTISLLLWNSRTQHDKGADIERKIIHQMVDRRVEGILLRPSSEDFEPSYFEEIWERDIPLIAIDLQLQNIETDFAGTDDVMAGRLAAEYLTSLGHRNILFLGDTMQVSTSRLRAEGFKKFLHDIPDAKPQFIEYTLPSQLPEISDIMTREDAPTAIFCYHDELAHIVAAHLLLAGLQAPRDYSLMGCGNVPNTYYSVPLTTIEQHPFKVGQAAAKLYLERTRESTKDGVRCELIKPSLVERASTRAISS